MTNNLMLGGVYVLMAIMLLLGTLMSRREKPARMLTLMLAWISIFGGGFVLFTFRDDLGYVAQRLRSEATGEPVTAGREVRIPMAIDGHFWVDARLNGQDVKFLVDSGATMTTIGTETARTAGIEVNPQRNQVVRTGNGIIKVATGRADTLEVGPIERRDMNLHIAGTDADLNVLGMNFLSSLQRWGVEGRWLILVP
jgi:aspartyl protease family protein